MTAQCKYPSINLLGTQMVQEKAMAPHSSILAWRIPGTMEPGGLPSMGSHRVRHNWSDLAAAAAAAESTGLALHIPSTWGTRLWLRTGKMSEEKNNLAVFFFFFPFFFSYFLKKFSPCSNPTPSSSLLPNEHETSLWIRQFHSKWGDLQYRAMGCFWLFYKALKSLSLVFTHL